MTTAVIERATCLLNDGRKVPVLSWEPEEVSRPPVVLLGHGGSGSKRSARNERLARWLANEAGLASVAIDGPFHGDRVAAPVPPAIYQRQMADAGAETVIEGMVADWLAALDLLTESGRVDGDRVAYVGLSFGSRVGIPLAAALGRRLRCAVFGKFGLMQSELLPAELATPRLIADAAAHITAPVMLHMQWDDELFPREGQFDLFEAFAASEKILVARAGEHGRNHIADELRWCAFVAGHMTT